MATLGLLVGFGLALIGFRVGQKARPYDAAPVEPVPFIGEQASACLDGPELTRTDTPAPAGLTSKTFARNESFRLEPSAASDRAWRSILPSAHKEVLRVLVQLTFR